MKAEFYNINEYNRLNIFYNISLCIFIWVSFSFVSVQETDIDKRNIAKQQFNERKKIASDTIFKPSHSNTYDLLDDGEQYAEFLDEEINIILEQLRQYIEKIDKGGIQDYIKNYKLFIRYSVKVLYELAYTKPEYVTIGTLGPVVLSGVRSRMKIACIDHLFDILYLIENNDVVHSAADHKAEIDSSLKIVSKKVSILKVDIDAFKGMEDEHGIDTTDKDVLDAVNVLEDHIYDCCVSINKNLTKILSSLNTNVNYKSLNTSLDEIMNELYSILSEAMTLLDYENKEATLLMQQRHEVENLIKSLEYQLFRDDSNTIEDEYLRTECKRIIYSISFYVSYLDALMCFFH